MLNSARTNSRSNRVRSPISTRLVVSGGAELVQLGRTTKGATKQQQEPLSESENPRWALELVERSAEGMAGQIFAAIDGDMCRPCPVRTSCPVRDEGRQVTA